MHYRDLSGVLLVRNCSPHIIRQTINVSSIGRRVDTKLHEQMKICVNSMLCLMARPQIHLPNVKTCLDVVNTYLQAVPTVRDRGRPQIRAECEGSDAAAPVLLQDIRYPRCGRRGFWNLSGHRIALHRADSACRKEVRAHTGKALRKVQEGSRGQSNPLTLG